ncbi:hypothetical protein [Chengkuizengella sediminis]|uniref:hypothetical protein n=1 Tax=Chengkuizengella sediminis TaxID=1885917 RepID=UPI0013898A91|nr:hypothetical protein [Chengkuizengella sediminis]NDI34569.1 hypothetical protein [Chengkuizengella sediminis]
MIFIKLGEKIEEKKVRITLIHYMPFDEKEGLSDTEIAQGVLIENMPEKDETLLAQGSKALLYYNPYDKSLFYEYEQNDEYLDTTQTKRRFPFFSKK